MKIPSSRKTHPGFSLIEMIMVLFVAGILVAIVATKWTGVDSHASRMAARQLVHHLRYAQNLSIYGEKDTRIVFSVVSNQYSVFTNAGGVYVPAIDPVTQSNWITRITSEYAPATLQSVSINGNSILVFGRTNGIPYDASTQKLAAAGTIVFSGGQVVTVYPETGYVGISE